MPRPGTQPRMRMNGAPSVLFATSVLLLFASPATGMSVNSAYPRRTGRFARGKNSASLIVISTFTLLFPGSGPVYRR
jgi:hypothetical protein